jgi:DNA-directed RNA polymerase subunit RPC12/RpoP
MAKCTSCGKEFEFPNYLMASRSVGKDKEIYPTCPYCGFNLNEGKKKTANARSRVEKLVGGTIG